MDIDIDNINTFENKNKVNTIKWISIYEVIDKAYFIYYKFFSNDFMKQCKNNAYDAQFILLDKKNNIIIMAMKQGSYAQVIMICRKYIFILHQIRTKMKLNSTFSR